MFSIPLSESSDERFLPQLHPMGGDGKCEFKSVSFTLDRFNETELEWISRNCRFDQGDGEAVLRFGSTYYCPPVENATIDTAISVIKSEIAKRIAKSQKISKALKGRPKKKRLAATSDHSNPESSTEGL
jgi:hypothetical protein